MIKVLICDDDSLFAKKVESMVQGHFRNKEMTEIVTTVCYSGQQAMELNHLEEYDVAFLDVDMKQMNGLALGKQ